jgi:Protein of unknown function (DUF2510)
VEINPPGWYPDPDPAAPDGRYRYWTGRIWTQHVASGSQPGSRGRRWVKPAVAVLVVGVLVALGGYFVAGRSTTTYPEAWDPQVAPIARKVEQLRGLRFEHPVPVRYVPEAEFKAGVGVDASKLSPAARRQVANLASTFRALGLIDAQTDLVKSLDTVNQAGVLAYYDPDAKEVVIRGVGPLDVERKATLAHELTHVLQDQHFDLESTRAEAARSDTASSGALTALIEGDAERVKFAYLRSLPAPDRAAYDAAEAKTNDAVGNQVAGAAEIVRIEISAPYIFGPDVLKVLAAEGGNAAVDDALRRAAPTDAIFLDPATALKDPEAVSVSAPSLHPGDRQIGAPDTIGAFDLFTVLASRIDRGAALEAADTWAGDRIVTYRSDGRSCVRASIAAKTSGGGAVLRRALRSWAATMPGATVAAETDGRRSMLTSCAGSTPAADSTRLEGALTLLAGRNGVLASLLHEKVPVTVGECVSHDLARTPLFVSLVARDTLTEAEQTDVRAQVTTLMGQCVNARGPS